MNGNCTHCNSDPCRCAEVRAEVDQRKTLLAKREKHKSEMSLDEMQARDETNRKNKARLVALMKRYRLLIPYRDFDKWRPTVETTGEVEGFWHLGQLRCVATDGLQAWFLRWDNEPWIGHVGNFKWDKEGDDDSEPKFGAPPPFFSLPHPEKVKKPRVSKTRLSAAEKLLKQL